MATQTDAAEFTPSPNLLSPSYEIKSNATDVNFSVEESQDENAVFIERREPTNALGTFEYPRNRDDPGLVLIFNQETFDNYHPRSGSRRDVNEIISCMGRLGYNITKNNVFTDLTRQEVLDAVENFAAEDLSQYNCLIVFFLTHGDAFNTLHAADVSLQAPELWAKFAKHPQLRNKPKMFIFQACKGEDHSKVNYEGRRKIKLLPDNMFNSASLGPDMLIVYSATEENVSFRNTITGSWFVQELCKNFASYGRRDDILNLLIRTTKCVCRNHYHHAEGRIKKQMPLFVSTLTKKFYLNRSKDRILLLNLLQKYDDLHENVIRLENKVDMIYKICEEKDKKKN